MWTAISNNPEFITITAGASGMGNGTVSYSVAANSNTTSRTGTISVAGQLFTVTQDGATPTATPTPTPAPTLQSQFQFSAANFSANESTGSATIAVTRTGDASSTVSVDYKTVDDFTYRLCGIAAGSADQRCDYTTTVGTLIFNAGETTKTFVVPLIDDAYTEGTETIPLALSTPTNGASLAAQSTAVLTINDNDTGAPTVNPIDSAPFFVRQQYYDFLNRLPDDGGLAYWTSLITSCNGDAACINRQRIAVSAAFFIEQEFQLTGNYVYRMYKAAYGERPLYTQFLPDRARINPEQSQLEASKQQFAELFVRRVEFIQRYPVTLSGEQFIDALIASIQQKSGVDLSGQRAALISDYASYGSRARIVRLLAENQAFKDAEYNKAFVLMQYFGYLRRDPDQGGYDFWLSVLNDRVPGNFRSMVCAFITSREYQERFSSVVTRTDSVCGQ